MKFNKHPWIKHFNNEYKFTFDENQLDIDSGNNLNIRTHEFSSFNDIIRDFFKLNINADEFGEQFVNHWNTLYPEKANS